MYLRNLFRQTNHYVLILGCTCIPVLAHALQSQKIRSICVNLFQTLNLIRKLAENQGDIMEQVYFYSRISTLTQSAGRQIENFRRHPHYKPENVFIDKIQGNVPFLQRPQAAKLYDLITSLDAGEEELKVVVDSIDRLGRNLLDILHTIELFHSRKINLQSLKESFETRIDGKENPIAKVVIGVMATISEMERERIKERTKEGIQLAKGKGMYRGRKIGSKQTDEQLLKRHPIIVEKLKRGLTVRDVAAIANKSTSTVVKVRKTLIKRAQYS